MFCFCFNKKRSSLKRITNIFMSRMHQDPAWEACVLRLHVFSPWPSTPPAFCQNTKSGADDGSSAWGPCHPHGRSRMSFGPLASVQPRISCCQPVRSKLQDEKPFSPSLCLSNKKFFSKAMLCGPSTQQSKHKSCSQGTGGAVKKKATCQQMLWNSEYIFPSKPCYIGS